MSQAEKEKLSSPIFALEADIRDAARRIAPEKATEWADFETTFTPTHTFTTDPSPRNESEYRFRVQVKNREIKLPIVAMEYLWATCFAAWVFYQEYERANQTAAEYFDPEGTPRGQQGTALYDWARKQLDKTQWTQWPKELPRPDRTFEDCSDGHVANELFLCALAWIIQHEYGHIKLEHSLKPLNNEESRNQERDADKYANDWILSDAPCEKNRKKRGLGIALAILSISAHDISLGGFTETTHPKSYERLLDALEPTFGDDPDHVVWAMSVVIYHLNMAWAKIPIAVNPSETWRENFVTSFVGIERHE